MRWPYLLIALFYVLPSSARPPRATPCGAPQVTDQRPLRDLAFVACENLRTQFRCDELEKGALASTPDAEHAQVKTQFIRCERGGVATRELAETQWLGPEGCLVGGVKLTVDTLVALSEGVVNFFKDVESCYQDVQKKREMVALFNLSVDERHALNPKVVDAWTCGEVEKQLSARKAAYESSLHRARIQAVNQGRRPAPLAQAADANLPGRWAEVKAALQKAREAVETRYQCYTPKAKAEMICAGVTSLVIDIALTGGTGIAAKTAIHGMRGVLRSSAALERIGKASRAGSKVDLSDASLLTKSDRWKAAELLLDKKLTREQREAIRQAHEVGLAEGRGFGSYTADDIAKKARILREAGIDPKDTRTLMESGITGKYGNEVRISAERLRGEAFTKGREKLPEAIAEGRKFYAQFVNDGKMFFTPDEQGFSRLMDANALGLSSRETVEAFAKNMGRDKALKADDFRAAYSSVNNYLERYVRPLRDPMRRGYDEYRALELRQKFLDEYLTRKYPNKYGELDLDRVDPRELRLMNEAASALEKARREAQRLKLPVE